MERIEQNKILHIQMLGDFHMNFRGRPVLMEKNLNGKMLHLLFMLLYFREEGIRREILLERLYMDRNLEQASNSLRAIVYRLRRSLVAAGLPEDNYITTKGGVYRWQSEYIEVVLDVEEFQKMAEAALAEVDLKRKEQLLEEACQGYRGEFLSMMIAEEWVYSANLKYQELYFRCLRELSQLLKEQNACQKLLGYCDQALMKYPYEEWQLLKLDCLIALKEYRAALKYYERTAAEFQRDFGTQPSQEMVKRYRSIKNMIQFEMGNLEDIQNRLKPDKPLSGATKCDYLTFMDIYRYMVWVFERGGIKNHLVLFTITDNQGVPLAMSVLLEEVRQVLEAAISSTVQREDLYTRYGKNQFLMLIVGAEEAECEAVCTQIRNKFKNLNRRKKIMIYYTYKPAQENSALWDSNVQQAGGQHEVYH